MNNLRTMLFTFLSLFWMVLAVVLVIQNWHTDVTITLGQSTGLTLKLGALLIGVYLLGTMTVFFKVMDLGQQMRFQIKHAELRKEKAEVKAETNVDQVRALESKVQTLEKALEQALAASRTER